MGDARFLFVQSTTEQGGAETILLNVFAASAEMRARAAVATLGFGRGDLPVRLTSLGVRVFELRAGRLRNPWGALKTVRAIACLKRELGAQVIVGNGSHPQVYAGLAAQLTGAGSVHLVNMIHRVPLLKNHPIDLLAIVGPCDLAVTLSEASRQAMAQLRPRLIVEALHPGTPISPAPAEQAAAARRELGASTGDTLFGIFGRLQRWKGQDVFIEAAKRLAAVEPRARFAVVGGAVFGLEPEYESLLKRLAGEAGLRSRVVFTGHRTDVARLMAACDVVCHATRVPEPFGMVIVEAMAQGRPVVATRGGGPSEIVVDGVTGLLVAPDDARAMAEAMARFGGDPIFRRETGEAGLRRVIEKFSATVYAEKLVRRLDAVAAGASIPAAAA